MSHSRKNENKRSQHVTRVNKVTMFHKKTNTNFIKSCYEYLQL